MIGPMKKKVITSSVVTAIVFTLIFTTIFVLYAMQSKKQIEDLTVKSEVVQRYVFTKNLASGHIVTADDLKYVDVKGESAPNDSYVYSEAVVNGQKLVTDMKNDIIGKRLKINVQDKTIVTSSLFFDEDKAPDIDTRLQEYNMITLPSDLLEGDYIDVRIRFATGEDYSVIVGKKVEAVGALNEQSNTIFLKLSEEEINRMSSAIIESYINDGVLLYANRYVDPANQLFDYQYIDLVKQYEENRYTTVKEEEMISGELVTNTSQKERTSAEIASLLGITVDDVEDLKEAVTKNDKNALARFQDKLVKVEKSIQPNYPVKAEVATLIRNNPNILSDVKAKYDVAGLMAERENFLSTELTTQDSFTGEIKQNTEAINHIKERLDTEIETQRTERQEYLLNLLNQQ